MNNPFGTQLMQKILLNPKTRPYLNDKEFMAKIQRLQTDPNSLMELISDPKVMEVLGMSLGGGMEDDDEDEPPPGKAWETLRKPQAPPTSSASSASCGSSCGDCGTGTKSADMDMDDKDDDVEDMTDETPAERKRREDQAAATKCKERGNELYKAK